VQTFFPRYTHFLRKLYRFVHVTTTKVQKFFKFPTNPFSRFFTKDAPKMPEERYRFLLVPGVTAELFDFQIIKFLVMVPFKNTYLFIHNKKINSKCTLFGRTPGIKFVTPPTNKLSRFRRLKFVRKSDNSVAPSIRIILLILLIDCNLIVHRLVTVLLMRMYRNLLFSFWYHGFFVSVKFSFINQ
jgi:hypothetical protein